MLPRANSIREWISPALMSIRFVHNMYNVGILQVKVYTGRAKKVIP